MEYFGFASGSSKTGPAFPYMPESVLSNYPNTLLEHPVVPTAFGFLNTYIPTPYTKDLVTAVQTWADKSLELLERPSVQAVGIGLSASICVYGAWKIRNRWKPNIVTVGKDDIFHNIESGEPHNKEPFFGELHTLGSLEGDLTDPKTDLTLRQLVDTRAKLDDLRFQMNQVEGEKDMLAAEVSMRKKIVAQLQGEIHIERDKRRQAELRMEMMEWENTHLRRLRKDVAVKEGKIDMLEACLKEKDLIHDKLFQENVILPKSVAAARAKEYEILHTKVQKYEMDAVMQRNLDVPYKPNRHESVTSILGQPNYDDTTETMETAVNLQRHYAHGSSESFQPSDWDKSPSSTGSAREPALCAASLSDNSKSFLLSPINWSDGMNNPHGEVTRKDCNVCKTENCKGSYQGQNQDSSWKGIEMQAKSRKATQQTIAAQHSDKTKSIKVLNRNSHVGIDAKTLEKSSNPICSRDDDPGVLDQIKSFLSGFSHSDSESCLTSAVRTPAQMAEVLPSQSRLWDKSFQDKANNCCQEDEGDDASCPSVSDGQSSVFLSASCGSDPSDNDIRDVSRSFNKSKNRRQSLKRIASSAKTKTSKRTISPAKAGSLADHESKRRPTSSTKESYLKNALPSNRVPAKRSDLPEQVSIHTEIAMTENNPPAADVKLEEQKMICHQSRARQRRRVRKSRSKLTLNSNASSHTGTQACEIAQQSDMQSQRSGRLLPEQEMTNAPQHTLDSIGNQAANKTQNMCPRQDVAHSRQIMTQATPGVRNVNQKSAYATDTDSEESWIVITPAK